MFRVAVIICMLITSMAFDVSAADKPTGKEPIPDEAVILHELDALQTLLSDGVAGPGPEPTIVFGPDGDAFVLFDMESWGGSNSLTQYIAVFTKVDTTGWQPGWSSHGYSLSAYMKLGAGQQDWEFQAEDLAVDTYDVITVKGHTWGPKDPHCCPSIAKAISVKYSDDALTYLGDDKAK